MIASVSNVTPIVERRSGRESLLLAASFGGQPSGDPEDWTFPTICDGLLASYSERWILQHTLGVDVFQLERAYFHLLCETTRARGLVKVLAIHCDANELAEKDGYGQTWGPHVHVMLAQDPLHRVHLPLELSMGESAFATRQEHCRFMEAAMAWRSGAGPASPTSRP